MDDQDLLSSSPSPPPVGKEVHVPDQAGRMPVDPKLSPKTRVRILCSKAHPSPDAIASMDQQDHLMSQTVQNDPSIMSKISHMNGLVNRQSESKVRSNLREFRLHDDGSEESCRLRLKNHIRRQAVTRSMPMTASVTSSQYFDVICVLDFEATCDSDQDNMKERKQQEIIEFPAILIDVTRKEIISTFHKYVKPIMCDNVSEFCTKLTGITNDMIHKADEFPKVLDQFEDWLYHELERKKYTSFALASDGSWDFAHFLPVSCLIHGIPYPAYAKRWINVRKLFTCQYKQVAHNLSSMLTYIGLQFEGRKHCGFDDSRNIARLVIRMIIDGAVPVMNERISWHSGERTCWPGVRAGFLRIFHARPSNGLQLSDSEDEVYESVYSGHAACLKTAGAT